MAATMKKAVSGLGRAGERSRVDWRLFYWLTSPPLPVMLSPAFSSVELEEREEAGERPEGRP